MHPPYLSRSQTKKQTHNSKPPISIQERKIREEKKRLAKLFSNLQSRVRNKITSMATTPPLKQRFKTGTYNPIFNHLQSPLSSRRGGGGEARKS